MATRTIIDLPLNRVEGDLEIRVAVEDGVVTDAWSSGTLYRGFETMLVGRKPLDSLVITPRICGICSTTHLMAAAKALDRVAGASVPDNAARLRNIALMAETIQSDVRHALLMFLVDFASPHYRDHPLFEEAVRRYEPFRGEAVVAAVRATKRVLEIVAILGGQWPHSSFMVPGGIASAPHAPDLMQCRHLLRDYREWYERRVLGCSVERWQAVASANDLDAWLDETAAHRDGDLGFFLRFARIAGLDAIGRGCGAFLSYGSLELPGDTAVAGGPDRQLVPAGFLDGRARDGFDQGGIREDVSCAWYQDDQGPRHPFEGVTRPTARTTDGVRYSWAKAPRYRERPAETGPLAERLIAGDPLFTDLVRCGGGPSVLVRQLARMARPALLLPAMDAWLDETARAAGQPYYRAPPPIADGDGFGLIQAARGALGHWVRVREGRIHGYQIITPTAWNGSPRDGTGRRGPWEEALIGTPVPDPEDPVAVGHVIRSFDACLVCTVHTVRRNRTLARVRLSV